MKLSYTQLRDIVEAAAKAPQIRKLFSAVVDGKTVSLDEQSILDLIMESRIDAQIISIVTGEDGSELDAIQGMEILRDFFGYWRSNAPRLSELLLSIGYQTKAKTTKASMPTKKAY